MTFGKTFASRNTKIVSRRHAHRAPAVILGSPHTIHLCRSPRVFNSPTQQASDWNSVVLFLLGFSILFHFSAVLSAHTMLPGIVDSRTYSDLESSMMAHRRHLDSFNIYTTVLCAVVRSGLVFESNAFNVANTQNVYTEHCTNTVTDARNASQVEKILSAPGTM